jgi:hypothetical protein
MRTRRLMILIGLLGALMAVPFQCRNELYRFRADRHYELARDARTAELRARARGDHATAEQHWIRAERREAQGWIYRKASYHHWEMPDWSWRRRSS